VTFSLLGPLRKKQNNGICRHQKLITQRIANEFC